MYCFCDLLDFIHFVRPSDRREQKSRRIKKIVKFRAMTFILKYSLHCLHLFKFTGLCILSPYRQYCASYQIAIYKYSIVVHLFILFFFLSFYFSMPEKVLKEKKIIKKKRFFFQKWRCVQSSVVCYTKFIPPTAMQCR